MIRKVIGVPDSYVVEVDGCRYCHNKCDLTLSPPGASNNDDDESDGDNHHTNQAVPMATAVMPTLHPRPQIILLACLYRPHNRKTLIYNAT